MGMCGFCIYFFVIAFISNTIIVMSHNSTHLGISKMAMQFSYCDPFIVLITLYTLLVTDWV